MKKNIIALFAIAFFIAACNPKPGSDEMQAETEMPEHDQDSTHHHHEGDTAHHHNNGHQH